LADVLGQHFVRQNADRVDDYPHGGCADEDQPFLDTPVGNEQECGELRLVSRKPRNENLDAKTWTSKEIDTRTNRWSMIPRTLGDPWDGLWT